MSESNESPMTYQEILKYHLALDEPKTFWTVLLSFVVTLMIGLSLLGVGIYLFVNVSVQQGSCVGANKFYAANGRLTDSVPEYSMFINCTFPHDTFCVRKFETNDKTTIGEIAFMRYLDRKTVPIEGHSTLLISSSASLYSMPGVILTIIGILILVTWLIVFLMFSCTLYSNINEHYEKQRS